MQKSAGSAGNPRFKSKRPGSLSGERAYSSEGAVFGSIWLRSSG